MKYSSTNEEKVARHHVAPNSTPLSLVNRSAEPAYVFDTLLVGGILANRNKKRNLLQPEPVFYLRWP